MEEILSLFFKKQKKMEQLKNVEENIYSSAVAIRKELEECTYNTSWPPSCDELDERFPRLFGNFCLLSFAMTQHQIMTKQKELYHRCLKIYFMLFSSGKEIDSKEYSPPTFNQVADKQYRTYYHNLKTGTWCVLYKIGRSYHLSGVLKN